MLLLLLLFAFATQTFAACPNACNGNGSCNKYSACDCYRNFSGADCSERVCSFGHSFVDTPAGDLNADGRMSTSTATYRVILGSKRSFFSEHDSNGDTVGTSPLTTTMAGAGLDVVDPIAGTVTESGKTFSTFTMCAHGSFGCTAGGQGGCRGDPDCDHAEREESTERCQATCTWDTSVCVGAAPCDEFTSQAACEANVGGNCAMTSPGTTFKLLTAVNIEYSQDPANPPQSPFQTNDVYGYVETCKQTTGYGNPAELDYAIAFDVYAEGGPPNENDFVGSITVQPGGDTDSDQAPTTYLGGNQNTYSGDTGSRNDGRKVTIVCSVTPSTYEVQWSNARQWEAYPTDFGAAREQSTDASLNLYDEAHFYAECSNKGICNRSTGLCECFPGYEGEGCTRTSCPNDCSGHGVCQRAIDAQGPNDSEYRAWDAYKTQICVCDAGYKGTDCSMRKCPQGDDPITRIHNRNEIQTVVFKGSHSAYADAGFLGDPYKQGQIKLAGCTGPAGCNSSQRQKSQQLCETDSCIWDASGQDPVCQGSSPCDEFSTQEACEAPDNYGAIVGVTISDSGTGHYHPGTYTSVKSATSGSGTGATFDVTVNNAGELSSVAVNSPGRGYSSMDYIFLFYHRMGLINLGVSGTTLNSGGVGYNPGTYTNVATTVMTGGGTGATLDITIDGDGVIDSVTVNSLGSGYAVGQALILDLSDIGEGTGADISIMTVSGPGGIQVDSVFSGTVVSECAFVATPRPFVFSLEFEDELGDSWVTKSLNMFSSSLQQDVTDALTSLPNNVIEEVLVDVFTGRCLNENGQVTQDSKADCNQEGDATTWQDKGFNVTFTKNTGDIPLLRARYRFGSTANGEVRTNEAGGAFEQPCSEPDSNDNVHESMIYLHNKCTGGKVWALDETDNNAGGEGMFSIYNPYVTGTEDDAIKTYSHGNKENVECSNRGLCDYTTGICRCFAGFTNHDCSEQNALSTQ